jgi:hypothetical protein
MAKKFDPKKDLRNRMAASEQFARRDRTYTSSGEGTGKRTIVRPKRGEFIPFYDDVTNFYNEIVKYGHEGRGGGDFPEAQAKKNTIKGRQYLDSTQGRDVYGSKATLGKKVKYGTVAGPKTVTNLADMEKARKMNEKRDKNNMMLRRGKGR